MRLSSGSQTFGIDLTAIIDGNRVFKASNVRKIHPVTLALAKGLSKIDSFSYIKIYNDRICASNQLSCDRKKEPITKTGQDGIIGVQLLIDPDHRVAQFYSLTSFEKGNGRRIVESVVQTTPEDWVLVVPMDWSGGIVDNERQASSTGWDAGPCQRRRQVAVITGIQGRNGCTMGKGGGYACKGHGKFLAGAPRQRVVSYMVSSH